jgi:hypothetical protein
MAKVVRVALTLAALGMNLLLSACQVQATVTPSPAPMPSETATRSPTPVPSSEPSPSPTPEPSPTATATPIPTPPFPASQVAHSLFLSTGTSATCELPCWHGLRIGESTRGDVEQVFADLLSTAEGYDFFSPPTEENPRLAELLDIVEGAYGGAQYWYLEDEKGVAGSYYLYAFISEDTGLLVGIVEVMDSFTAYDVPSLSEIVARLGPPGWVYGGSAGGVYAMALYYRQGIGVKLSLPRANIDASTATVCFDEEPITEGYGLVDPYISPNEEDFSPMQRIWNGPRDPAPYIDEELGASIDEFVALINSDNPCMQVSR